VHTNRFNLRCVLIGAHRFGLLQLMWPPLMVGVPTRLSDVKPHHCCCGVMVYLVHTKPCVAVGPCETMFCCGAMQDDDLMWGHARRCFALGPYETMFCCGAMRDDVLLWGHTRRCIAVGPCETMYCGGAKRDDVLWWGHARRCFVVGPCETMFCCGAMRDDVFLWGHARRCFAVGHARQCFAVGPCEPVFLPCFQTKLLCARGTVPPHCPMRCPEMHCPSTAELNLKFRCTDC